MSHLRRKSNTVFTVVIYEADYKDLCSWVLKKPNIETGGDLFGLWADKHTAVVQLVLGPGKDCRRTSVSFYQDVDYLKRVGTYLTEKEGLCHIGEWHSHHTLGLARPSGGDENTVWSNMPSYHLQRFVIFIANISSTPDKCNVAKVGCFLFELDDRNGSQKPVVQGKFRILPDKSPLHSKEKVHNGLSRQSESMNSPAELNNLSLQTRGELEMCPTVYKYLESLKRKGKDEKKNTFSPNLKQMKTERGEAVSSEGHKVERAQKKHLTSQGDKKGEPRDTERLAKKFQEQKLNDNVEHVEAATSLEPGNNGGDNDILMKDEEKTRGENSSLMQEDGEDKKEAAVRHKSQDEEAQGCSTDSEVQLELGRSGNEDHEKTEGQITIDEGPPQIREQDGEVQAESSTKNEEVHLESAKSGGETLENTSGQVTTDEGAPTAVDLVPSREQGEDVQEVRSTRNEVMLQSAKTANKDPEKTVRQEKKDEGTPSAANAVQDQKKKSEEIHPTKATKKRIPAPATSGEQTKQKSPGAVKSKEPSKKAGTLKTPGKSGAVQPVGRKASGTAGDKKGPSTSTKPVDPAKKGMNTQRRGQKPQAKLSTAVPQNPKKSGPGTAAATTGSTRQRQAGPAAQAKETATAKKTNQPRTGETGKRTTTRK